MQIIYLLLGLSLLPSHAKAEGERVSVLSCAYKFGGADFAQVELGILAGGVPEEYVTISQYGRSHRESATPDTLKAGESLHYWISKESDKNSLEVIVFQERKAQGQSVMINSRMPFGKEMWADCVSKPAQF